MWTVVGSHGPSIGLLMDQQDWIDLIPLPILFWPCTPYRYWYGGLSGPCQFQAGFQVQWGLSVREWRLTVLPIGQ